MFRSGRSGRPSKTSTVEAIVILPERRARTELLVTLRTRDVGIARDLEKAQLAEVDSHPPSLVGMFGAEARVGCEGTAPDGASCASGGSFWAQLNSDDTYEQLVTLSPFFVDRTEWSVRRFLDAGGVALDLPPSAGGGATCANASMPSAPATCMTPIEAERICRAAGGRLPTFHEFSFLIGGLRNQRYPWGSDTPSCNDAVIERFEVEGAGQRCSSANLGGFPVGPVPASEPYGRDVLTLPGGDAILHLVGNVSEIVRGTDQFLCRTTSSVMDDPRCSTNVWTQMGGSYLILRGADSVAATMATGDAKITTGFRCVYDAPRATRSRMAQDFPL
jgi:hypothetical protein